MSLKSSKISINIALKLYSVFIIQRFITMFACYICYTQIYIAQIKCHLLNVFKLRIQKINFLKNENIFLFFSKLKKMTQAFILLGYHYVLYIYFF